MNDIEKENKEHVVVWAAPELHWGVWEAHSIPKGARVAELRRKLAVFYMHIVEGIELYTSLGKAEDSDYVEKVCFFPVRVFLKRHEKEEASREDGLKAQKEGVKKMQRAKFVKIDIGWDSDGYEEIDDHGP